jgi:adenosine deaminase
MVLKLYVCSKTNIHILATPIFLCVTNNHKNANKRFLEQKNQRKHFLEQKKKIYIPTLPSKFVKTSNRHKTGSSRPKTNTPFLTRYQKVLPVMRNKNQLYGILLPIDLK